MNSVMANVECNDKLNKMIIKIWNKVKKSVPNLLY